MYAIKLTATDWHYGSPAYLIGWGTYKDYSYNDIAHPARRRIGVAVSGAYVAACSIVALTANALN